MTRQQADRLWALIRSDQCLQECGGTVVVENQRPTDFHQWFDHKKTRGVAQFQELSPLPGMYFGVNDWRGQDDWYVVGVTDDKRILFEIRHTIDDEMLGTCLTWEYRPVKRDSKNSERRELFKARIGDTAVVMPMPRTPAETADLLRDLSRLGGIRLDADNLLVPSNGINSSGQVLNRDIEGRVLERLHFERERKPRLIVEAKRLFRAKHGGKLYCEVCSLDFAVRYGPLGEDFIEGHHTRPISALSKCGEVVDPAEIAIVCSNCHSMIHRRRPCLSVDELKGCYRSHSR